MPFKDPEEKKLYHRGYSREYYRNMPEEEKKDYNHKNWLARDKDKRNAYARKFQKENRKRIKLEVIEHYGGKCVCCGEINIGFLTIDHINNDGAEHRRKMCGSHIYEWLKWNHFPEGYQVMCWNCNCGRQYNNGICPHKESIQLMQENQNVEIPILQVQINYIEGKNEELKNRKLKPLKEIQENEEEILKMKHRIERLKVIG